MLLFRTSRKCGYFLCTTLKYVIKEANIDLLMRRTSLVIFADEVSSPKDSVWPSLSPFLAASRKISWTELDYSSRV